MKAELERWLMVGSVGVKVGSTVALLTTLTLTTLLVVFVYNVTPVSLPA